MSASVFETFKQSFFQRVAVSPGSPRPTAVVLSDIVLHLPVLQYYSSLCQHVTEFGVREGCSTVALISGCRMGEVHSYDIVDTPVRPKLEQMALPCSWHFHQGDTGDPALPAQETDLLFLDTLHTHEHLSKELAHHGRKARKFLIFHDTHTCGYRDESGPDPTALGIVPAIQEFLDRYPGGYRTVYRTSENNGLWVLERRSY
jgi:cephalosporin hydroxylase